MSKLTKLVEQIREELATLSEAREGTVRVFLTILTHKLTMYDKRLSTRQPNTFRLGHFLDAASKVEKDMKRHLDSDDPKHLEKLKAAIGKRFIVRDMPPAKAVIKQIDAFIDKGKLPKL